MAEKPTNHGRDHRPGGPDPLLIKRFIPVVLDGFGSALTVGVKGDVTVHIPCTIESWRILADQAGDIQIDIWKSDYAGFPPSVADTITGSAAPTLSASDKATSSTLTGWTTAISNGDTLRFHVDSVSTVTRVTLTLAILDATPT